MSVGVNVRTLPLSPLEGFVLSRVDGAASVGDIADLTGQSVDECVVIVDRLIGLGAVEWADGSVSLPRTSFRPPSSPTSSIRPPPQDRPSMLPKGVLVEERTQESSVQDRRSEPPSRGSAPRPRDSAPRSMPAGTASDRPAGVIAPITGHTEAGGMAAPDEIELSLERRKQIDDLWIALDLLNHYEILGVARKSTQREVKNAYFQKSKIFHPDTAFRKKVGMYRTKMEAIFKRLTEAEQVLGRTKARADYDAYLASIGETKDAEEALSGEHEMPPAIVDAAPPPATDVSAPPTSAPPPPEPVQPVPHVPARSRTVSEDSRRRAAELFQKRLEGARGLRATPKPFSAPAPEIVRTPEEMARELREIVHTSAQVSGGAQNFGPQGEFLQRQLIEARRAEDQGELALAVRALRMALATAPDRADVAAEHERVSRLLAVSLADRYTDQAGYEERHKKWAAAAVSWSKVLEGRPDDLGALFGATRCLIEAQGDLKRAQRFAQRAVDLAPQELLAHKLLARVCIAGGLPLNARRALQTAAGLAPEDQEVRDLLKALSG